MLTQDQPAVNYDFDDGPRLINEHGDWGVFIGGQMVDGPFYNRDKAYQAYGAAVRELAERERDIPFNGEPVPTLDDDDTGLPPVYW